MIADWAISTPVWAKSVFLPRPSVFHPLVGQKQGYLMCWADQIRPNFGLTHHAYLAKSRDKGFGFAADTSELGLLFVMTKHISPFGGSEAGSAYFWLLIVLNLNPSCVLQRRSVQKGHNSNRKHLSR